MEPGTFLTLLMVVLGAGASDDERSAHTHQVSTSQCGEYSNQVMKDGTCKLVATLPQLDEHRCPDMFRCTDEVSYWLHENEERKQQILVLHETISELQEELRNHRHRVKVLELQVCVYQSQVTFIVTSPQRMCFSE
ncbi:fibrinogen-like protein 1 isoform X1 [Tachysurus ichikawai]